MKQIPHHNTEASVSRGPYDTYIPDKGLCLIAILDLVIRDYIESLPNAAFNTLRKEPAKRKNLKMYAHHSTSVFSVL